MRIGTITNWAYGVTIVLTSISGAAFIASERAEDAERAAVQQHLALDDLGDQLALGAETRSDQARLYAMRGAARHLIAFRKEERQERSRERAFDALRALALPPDERRALAAAETNLGELDEIERAAIGLVEHGDAPRAQAMLFGADHERAQTAVFEPIARFRALVSARTGAALDRARDRNDGLSDIARFMLALTGALFLAVLYFILRRRVSLPLGRMTGIVMRLARQDYTVEVPQDRRRDEIGEMTQAIHVFRDNGLERDRLEAERVADQRAKDAILKMMHRLQAAATPEELAEIVACFVPQTFPDLAGHLYVLDRTGTALTLAGSWLAPVSAATSFPSVACWAVRRGRPHVSHRNDGDIPCLHLRDIAVPSVCVPLTAQGDTIGLLYFEEREGAGTLGAASRLYVELMAENIGLALANLRLREQLTGLAIRDALTGLYNRRSLDEAINHQAREAPAGPIACLMIDIDHFKRFNDEFGHDAGDMVMQHVAGMMLDATGDLGRVYRFGGEEFTVLLPGSNASDAVALGELIRDRVVASPLSHRGRLLGHITVSIGVAAAPRDGAVVDVIGRADAALLEAKERGRNLVVSASSIGQKRPAFGA